MKASEYIALLASGITHNGDLEMGILNDDRTVSPIDGVDLDVVDTPAGKMFTIDATPLAEPLMARIPHGAPYTW